MVSLRRPLLFSLFAALAGCAADHADDPAESSASDLSTQVLAPNVSRLVEGPTGDIAVSLRSGGISVLDPVAGSLATVPGRSGYLASNGVTFSFSGWDKTYLSRKDASGVEVNVSQPLYNAEAIGFDAQYFYWFAATSDDYYAGRSIFRIGFEGGATPERIGDVGNGQNAPEPLKTLVAAGGVYWTTLPNTCTVGDGDSCWQVALGRATGSDAYGTRVTPRLADGTYVSLSALSFYEGDLYAASSQGVYKLPGGDLSKPFEQVCSIPSTFRVKLSNSTILVGTSRAGFAATSHGFVLPLQTQDYRSALGLVKWDCSTQVLTTFGAPASGSVSSYGLTQVADVVVRDDSIFWLDRQAYQSNDEYADSYYALKRTTF